jgi:hypothetical protein
VFSVKVELLFVKVKFALDDVQNLFDTELHVVTSLALDLSVLKVYVVAWMFMQVSFPRFCRVLLVCGRALVFPMYSVAHFVHLR